MVIAREDMRRYNFDKELLELNLVEALAKNTEYRNALLDIEKYLNDFSNNDIPLVDLISSIKSILEKTL